MIVRIPYSVEDAPKNCLIQLRSMNEDEVIAEVFRGISDVEHTIEFDTGTIAGGLEAGVYIFHVSVDGHTSTYPLQYMP